VYGGRLSTEHILHCPWLAFDQMPKETGQLQSTVKVVAEPSSAKLPPARAGDVYIIESDPDPQLRAHSMRPLSLERCYLVLVKERGHLECHSFICDIFEKIVLLFVVDLDIGGLYVRFTGFANSPS